MSNANTWANRTKAALSSADTSNLKPVGGGTLEPITKYYQFNAVSPKAGPNAAQMQEGASIQGTYEGSFTTKKFGTLMFKIRTADGLVAVTSTGQLKQRMSKVADGAEVKITYRGKEKIERGAMAGKQAHAFNVAASELKA